MSKADRKHKVISARIPLEDAAKLEAWLVKFSAGETFSDQMRAFIHWLVTQTEGIDQTKLALKLQQTEDENKKREFQ